LRSAAAQPYPSRPVRIIVGFSPGGAQDVLARLIGRWLSERLGQAFVIEYRPGGGGNIGAEAVVRAPPDGHTLLLVGPPNAINATLYEKLNYNFIRDIAPIAGIHRTPNVLAVHPSFPANTLAEFVAYAKANPGKVNVATSGIGASDHMSGELFRMMVGVDIVQVHYRGAAPAITDLLGGHIQMMIVSIGLVAAPWQAGKLTVLGFGSKSRLPEYPDVPTLAESGLPGYEAGSWYGLVAPKGTPREIVNKINAETRRVFDDPTFQKQVLAKSFIYSIVSSPDEFAERIRRDSEKWGKVIRAAHIKVD
jgi:tripartite-type tricarboxylate transporter receptor subunit TctC